MQILVSDETHSLNTYVLDIFYFQILKKCKINEVSFKKIERNQADGDNDDDDDDHDFKMKL